MEKELRVKEETKAEMKCPEAAREADAAGKQEEKKAGTEKKQDAKEREGRKKRNDLLLVLGLLLLAGAALLFRNVFVPKGAEKEIAISVDNEEIFRAGLFGSMQEVEEHIVYVDQRYVELHEDGFTVRLSEAKKGGAGSKGNKAEAAYNRFSVKENEDGSIGLFCIDADCPDQVCVNTGLITEETEIIVCLPHKLTARLVSKK